MLEKIRGQLKVIEKYAPDDAYTYNGQSINYAIFLRSLCTELAKATSISRVIEIESLAANLYWGVLSTMTLQFQQRDTGKTPEHWKIFGSRHSLINRKSNRNAINPANAMLNYLYALLYAETRLALLRVGFDPTEGLTLQMEFFMLTIYIVIHLLTTLWRQSGQMLTLGYWSLRIITSFR